MAISKITSGITANFQENNYAAHGNSNAPPARLKHTAASQRRRPESAAKQGLLNQYDDQIFSKKVDAFVESMMESVDAMDRLLSETISIFSQVTGATEKNKPPQTKTPLENIKNCRPTQSAKPNQPADLFSDILEKVDAVLKKLDELILSTANALCGFSRFSNDEEADLIEEPEQAQPQRPINLALPKIVEQTGHICKPTALANMDAYYANLHGINAIPLRKNHRQRYNASSDNNATLGRTPVSIRALSKRHGSIQGEVLEAEKYGHVAKSMGYSVGVMTPEDPASLKQIVLDHVAKGQPLVTCFAVDRENGLPSSHYSDNEHACVITGCDPVANTIDIAHWGRTFHAIPIEEMFASMNTLPAEREQEIYYRCEDFAANPCLATLNLKYDKEDRRIKGGTESEKKSIIPAAGSGFKNKIFSIVPDLNSPRWKASSSAN